MTDPLMCNNKGCSDYKADANTICPFCLDSLIHEMGHGDTFLMILKELYKRGVDDAITMAKELGILDKTALVRKLLELEGRLS